MNKTKVSLSIDTDLLRLAKSKYPNLSARVNQLPFCRRFRPS